MTVREEFAALVETFETQVFIVFKREIDKVIEESKEEQLNPLETYIRIAAKTKDLRENLGGVAEMNGIDFAANQEVVDYTREYEWAAIIHFRGLVKEIINDAKSIYGNDSANGLQTAYEKLQTYTKRLDDVGASYIYDDFAVPEKDEQDIYLK